MEKTSSPTETGVPAAADRPGHSSAVDTPDPLNGALDPFADVNDEPTASGADLRTAALARAQRLRGFVPLRKAFVQKPNTENERASVLAAMVRSKKTLALRGFLLIHALEPILSDTSWTLSVWAKLIAGTRTPHSAERVSAAFQYLENQHLITRARTGSRVHVYPLLEDGSGKPFVRASAKGADVGPGYLTIPSAFWQSGLSERLNMPGLAMLLVALHETTQKPNYQITLEQTATWFGISERTAERGYGELAREDLLLTKITSAMSIKSSTGQVFRTHRALAAPYSQDARAKLQAKVKAAAQKASRGDGG